MRLLLTNDDGIDAAGIAALERAARALGEVIVAAPASCWSGCGHRCTTDAPIAVEERGPGRYAIHGTPADCVRLALHALAPEVDWVLAGINHGGNLGADVFPSGTVAAAREGVLHGVPAVALSHYRRRPVVEDWERVDRWAQHILRDLLDRPWQAGSFWNVNFPSLGPDDPDPESVFCPVDPHPLPLDFTRNGEGFLYAGVYHERSREAGSDVDVCFGGRIAVSCVPVASR
jgi:5'-nucleotidase